MNGCSTCICLYINFQPVEPWSRNVAFAFWFHPVLSFRYWNRHSEHMHNTCKMCKNFHFQTQTKKKPHLSFRSAKFVKNNGEKSTTSVGIRLSVFLVVVFCLFVCLISLLFHLMWCCDLLIYAIDEKDYIIMCRYYSLQLFFFSFNWHAMISLSLSLHIFR